MVQKGDFTCKKNLAEMKTPCLQHISGDWYTYYECPTFDIDINFDHGSVPVVI